jgi:carbon monoxide dehydrogenase subunit G
MQFEGDKDFPLPPGELWPKLSDAGFLTATLANAEALVVHDADQAEWKLRPALSFVAGTLDTSLHIVERQPPDHMRLLLTSKGIGSKATTEVRLALAAHDAGTRVHWTGEITELTGLLKAVPKGLIQGTAKKVIEDIWAGVEKKLANP